MAKRALEMEVMKGSAHMAAFEVLADPDDIGTLRDALAGWLSGNKWKPATWGQFRADIRLQGGYKILKTVRTAP